MKSIYLFLILLIGMPPYSTAQQWSLSGFPDGGITSANIIERDASGNLYIAGSFTDSIQFNNQWYLSQGNFDGFILSLNASGLPRWIKTVGSTDGEILSDMGYRDGIIYLGGTFSSFMVNFQVSTIQNNSPGINDCFIAAMDTSGNFLWANSFGSSASSDVQLHDLHIADDALYIAGSFQGIFNAGNNVLSSSSGGYDSYLLKINLSGSTLWGRFGHGVGNDFLSAVTTDINGKVYCTGAFGNLSGVGNASFFIGNYQLTAIGGFGFYDMFIAKYDTAGILQYAFRDGGNNYDIPRNILLDGDKLLIGGTYYFTTVLNGVSYSTNGGNEGFVYCLDTAMTPLWSQIFTKTAGSTSYYDDRITDIEKQSPNHYYILNMIYAYGLEIILIDGNGTKLNAEELLTPHNSTYAASMISETTCGKLYVTSSFTNQLVAVDDSISGNYSDAFLAVRSDSTLSLHAPQNISGTGPDTLCADYPLFSISTDTVNGAFSYGWQVIPQQAGTITGQTNQATININNNYSGPLQIVCFASSSCNTSPASDTLQYFVKPVPLTPNIITNGLQLTAVVIASSYIWYNNGNVLPNDTGISILAVANGTYQVAAVSNGCSSSLSGPVLITTVGVTEITSSAFTVYPNPACDIVSLHGIFMGDEKYILRSTECRIIKLGALLPPYQIDLLPLENGCYFLEIIKQDHILSRKKLIISR